MSGIVNAVFKALSEDVIQSFERDHFVVLPADVIDTFQASVFTPLLDELKRCFDSVARIPNQIEFLLASGPVRLTKPHVDECDLHNDDHRSKLPLFSNLMEHELGPLAALYRSSMPSLADLCEIRSTADAKAHTTVKLQINTGGSFPWHYDNPGTPNKRRLTMAVYLTPNWSKERHGGELLLQPFLGPMVDVPPKFATIALFRSDTMLHAVRPFHATAECSARYCFTIWFDGTNTNRDDDVNLKAKHLTLDAVPLLRTTPLQRVLSRAVYDEEYRERLEMCFGDKDSRDARISIAMHEAHLKPLLANPAVRSFVEQLRTIKTHS